MPDCSGDFPCIVLHSRPSLSVGDGFQDLFAPVQNAMVSAYHLLTLSRLLTIPNTLQMVPQRPC